MLNPLLIYKIYKDLQLFVIPDWTWKYGAV